MKKAILILFIILVSMSFLRGQTYRVDYQMTYKMDSTKDETIKKKMILDVKDDISKFYSYNLYHIDSLGTNQIRKKASDYDFAVIKNNKDKTIEKYFVIGLDRYSFKENAPKFDWKITEEVRKIHDVTCQKAKLNYKGRNWEAWFAKDIPFQEGPYIFNSLPGLIIDMRDSGNNYIFIMTELRKDVGAVDPITETIPVTRKQLTKAYLDYYNDPYKELKAGKAVVKVVDESGRQVTPNFNQLTELKQKDIKMKNNPIELMDAIKYP